MKLLKHGLILFVALLVVITIFDLVRIRNYTTYPIRPEKDLTLNESGIYHDLFYGRPIEDWNALRGALEYIRGEFDCADFRLVNLIRILYEFEDIIPQSYTDEIEDILIGFRYWMDEPGENSMCYWSENHQILFASAEYLIGQKYPDRIFQNTGETGLDHMQKARQRILDWLQFRWDYGFTEFYSNVYYKEDIGALVNLIDYARDEEIVKKSQIVLDLLFYDVATQSLDTLFVSVSGRAYESHRQKGSMTNVTNYYWGDKSDIGKGMTFGLVATEKYQLPPVLKEIAGDTSNVEIMQSNGLDIDELTSEGFDSTDTRSIMMQWGMEAFVNPEVVRNSLSYIRSNQMFTNGFLTGFRDLDYSVLRFLHLEPLLVKLINPQSIGVAIQKGNTYTYRTEDYSLYTVQSYQVGDFGDQQHVAGMNIGSHFAIFHCHPAAEEGTSHSPDYWVGYGHFPHSVQDKNVNLSIYHLPEKKGLMEMDLLGFTHAYFPHAKFDSVILEENYVFGKKGSTYCAFIGRNPFTYRNDDMDDLIQPGKTAFWITEAGAKTTDGSFTNFVNRIKSNKIDFDLQELRLDYHSGGRDYSLIYDEEFKVNKEVVNTRYDRYDSPYVQAGRKPHEISITKDTHSLYLNFDNLIREFNTE